MSDALMIFIISTCQFGLNVYKIHTAITTTTAVARTGAALFWLGLIAYSATTAFK